MQSSERPGLTATMVPCDYKRALGSEQSGIQGLTLENCCAYTTSTSHFRYRLLWVEGMTLILVLNGQSYSCSVSTALYENPSTLRRDLDIAKLVLCIIYNSSLFLFLSHPILVHQANICSQNT